MVICSRSRILLLLACGIYWNVLAWDLQDMEKMTDKLSGLTSSTSDIFARLKYVGENSELFLKAIAAASPVIMAFATIGFDAKSPELKAIEKLRTDIFSRFDTLSNQHIRLTIDLKMHAMKMEYNNKITVELISMKRIAEETILLVDKFARPSLAGFIEKVCKTDTPKRMLDWLKTVTYMKCRPMDRRRIAILIEANDLFEKAETHFQNASYSEIQQYQFSKYHTLNYIVNELSYVDANETVDRLVQAFTKEHNAITAKKAELILVRNVYGLSFEEVKIDDMCLLSLAYLANDYRRTPLINMYKIVLDDVAYIEMYAGLCHRLQNQGSTENANKLDRLLNSNIKDVLDAMTLWMRFTLEQSWPYVWHRVAKEVIGQEDLAGDLSVYERAAFNISHELFDCGPERYLTQVLVSESCASWEDSHCDFVPDCPNDKMCTYIRNLKKVNVAMMRYDIEQATEKAEHSGIWFQSHYNDLIASVRKHYDINNYLDAENKQAYWREVLKGVERDVPGVRNSAYYVSRMILHINIPLDFETVIRARWTNHQIGMQSLNGSTSFELHVDPAVDNAMRIIWINFL